MVWLWMMLGMFVNIPKTLFNKLINRGRRIINLRKWEWEKVFSSTSVSISFCEKMGNLNLERAEDFFFSSSFSLTAFSTLDLRWKARSGNSEYARRSMRKKSFSFFIFALGSRNNDNSWNNDEKIAFANFVKWTWIGICGENLNVMIKDLQKLIPVLTFE